MSVSVEMFSYWTTSGATNSAVPTMALTLSWAEKVSENIFNFNFLYPALQLQRRPEVDDFDFFPAFTGEDYILWLGYYSCMTYDSYMVRETVFSFLYFFTLISR